MARFPDGLIFIPKFKDMTTTKEPGELVITVEQRELVCCKNCKYWNADDYDCNIKVGHFTATPDFFCADGERKED